MNSIAARFFTFSVLACICVFVRSEKATAAQNGSDAANAQTITILQKGQIPTSPGPAGRFTGKVSIGMMTEPTPPALTRVESVTFAPGAHTAWHSHPLGQTLVVTSGWGYMQQWGGRYTATMAKTARILGTVSIFCAGFLALFAINIVGWIGLVDFIWGIVALLAVLGVFAIIYGNALDRTDHRLVTELGLEAAHEEKDGLRQSDTQDARLNR